MRRKLATASWLIAVVLALVVAACGGSDNDKSSSTSKPAADANALKKGTTVNFWIMPNGPQPQADMEKTVAPFEQQTGVKVNVEVVGWDVQLDRIKNAAVSGQGPDVTQAGTTQVPFFAAIGGFEDLGSRISQIGGKSAYAPGVWQTTQLQGQSGTYAVPWFTEARAIYYRKDVLEKAGIDPATAFTDVNAFQQTLQTIHDKVPTIGGKPISPFGMPGKKAFDLVHHVMPFVWDNGGAELSDDASKSSRASTSWRSWSRRACSTRACSSVTARRSRTSSRAAGWPCGSAARGCCRRSRAPTTRTGSRRRATTSAWPRCLPARPARRSRSSAART